MEKKKVIVTLCKKFPATHPKAGVPTGFESKLKMARRSTLYGTMQKVYGMSVTRAFPLAESTYLLGNGLADRITPNKGSLQGMRK